MRRVPRPALFLLLLAAAPAGVAAQAARRSENVVLIVTDGLRWQEVFHGADTALANRKWGGVEDTAGFRRDFVRPDPRTAREMLLPFIWNVIGREGRLFGDSAAGSIATVTNGLKFSYPGYSEMIAGHADPRIDRNDGPPNPNLTVFEWLEHQPGLRGRVAVFGTWDAFPRIFNRERSGLPIRAAWEPPFAAGAGPAEATIDRLYATTTRLWSDVAYDGFMQAAVLQYIRKAQPRVLFVGYGETDEWAHSRRYDQTLASAHRVDAFIAELWRTMQAMPQYRGRTTFIVTTDHGRGGTPADWTDHGRDVTGAEDIWIAVLGPDTPPGGDERAPPVTQSQIAATVAAAVGYDYPAAEPAAASPIPGVVTESAEPRR